MDAPPPEKRADIVAKAVATAYARLQRKGKLSAQKLAKFLKKEHRIAVEGLCTVGEAKHAASLMLPEAKQQVRGRGVNVLGVALCVGACGGRGTPGWLAALRRSLCHGAHSCLRASSAARCAPSTTTRTPLPACTQRRSCWRCPRSRPRAAT
jgi:hypothetical protein